jgi:hypothetical protein
VYFTEDKLPCCLCFLGFFDVFITGNLFVDSDVCDNLLFPVNRHQDCTVL